MPSRSALFLAAIEASRRVPMTRAFVYEPKCDTILTRARIGSSATRFTFVLAGVVAAPVATHSVVARADGGRDDRLLPGVGARRGTHPG